MFSQIVVGPGAVCYGRKLAQKAGLATAWRFRRSVRPRLPSSTQDIVGKVEIALAN